MGIRDTNWVVSANSTLLLALAHACRALLRRPIGQLDLLANASEVSFAASKIGHVKLAQLCDDNA